MKRTEAQLISEATQHLTRLSGYVERSDLSDDIVFDAVCMRLSAAIDALSGIEQWSSPGRRCLAPGCSTASRSPTTTSSGSIKPHCHNTYHLE